MKKTPRKLVLRSETLRALANMDLSRVVAGVGMDLAIVDTGDKACETDAVVVVTKAGR